jgi:hypothetical protein
VLSSRLRVLSVSEGLGEVAGAGNVLAASKRFGNLAGAI